jgi:hypothetical protein
MRRKKGTPTSFLVTILLCTFDPLPEAILTNILYFLSDNPIQKNKENFIIENMFFFEFYFAIFLHIFPNCMGIFIDEDN